MCGKWTVLCTNGDRIFVTKKKTPSSIIEWEPTESDRVAIRCNTE